MGTPIIDWVDKKVPSNGHIMHAGEIMTNKLPSILKKQIKSITGEINASIRPLLSSNKGQKVLACSQFVANYCQRNPKAFKELVKSGDLKNRVSRKKHSSRLKKILKHVEEEPDLMQVLREFRNREMVRIAWRDIAGLAELEETMEDLSLLAEVMLDQTLDWLHKRLAERFGEPENENGVPQQMVIIAMGKLGAHELNFSSDIDLIFAFPEAGQTNGKKKSLDNQEFFIRLGKQLIKAFNEMTEDGFVFRVDMRLRPFGESGALVLNFDAMEEYYVSHARDWERYAMIKANIAAGDKVAGAELMKMLIPFVFRRYLDYGAYQAIREMKEMINREVSRKGMETDVKLGRGGIREVEFIGQTFQLLRGGREPILQSRKILDILDALEQMNVLSPKEKDELRRAYFFLRNTEHRIQEIADQQTQALPTNELDQARVACGMDLKNWEEFLLELARHRGHVSSYFAQLLRTSGDEEEVEISTDYSLLWKDEIDSGSALKELKTAGFDDPEMIIKQLDQLRENYNLQNLSKEGRERLDRLMPSVLEEVAGLENDDQVATLEHVSKLIESIARRSVYLSLLKEHPAALSRLIKLCAASPWIAEYITNQPILLDELIDQKSLYSPPEQEELSSLLNDQLIHLHLDDLERQMDTLRHFRHSQVLRVAAADITGNLPLEEVSNHLSAIAEVVLIAATRIAWREMVQRYGEPFCVFNKKSRVVNFTIIAYGKLGGIELGYGSDLDVVFLHDGRGKDQVTNGKKSVDNGVFFNRFGQRLINILTAMTQAGRTYEIDTRLRPNGLSGFLVSSIEAFTEYQKEKAWTWEHQALIRARPVVGEPAIQKAFNKIRNQILSVKRDEKNLKKEVREMREKMRTSLVKRTKETFDLKQGIGGMADIEFIVQYTVLRWAVEHKELLTFTDNLRLFEILAKLKILKKTEATLLKEAYFSYRTNGHRLALQEKSTVVAETEYIDFRAGVSKIWHRLLDN